MKTTLLPVPDGVGLNMITASAEVATNERRTLAKIRGKIFMGGPLPERLSTLENDFNADPFRGQDRNP